MSIIYCEKHDRRWDSDRLEMCPVCENGPMFPNDAGYSAPIEQPMSERERKLVEFAMRVQSYLDFVVPHLFVPESNTENERLAQEIVTQGNEALAAYKMDGRVITITNHIRHWERET